jgi:polysaccharide biosynthesis/export protein
VCAHARAGFRLADRPTPAAVPPFQIRSLHIQGAKVTRHFHHSLRLILSGFLALWLAGCASGPTLPPAPVTAGNADSYTYIIGAGDALNIIVWRNPELSMSVPVRPDGKVAAPLVEEIVAQGKTTTQLARDVEAQLAKYVRDPVVTVLVTGFVGPYSEQIRVVGEAAKPQFLNYKKNMTLLDVMIAVGGLTDFAAGNSATILRTSDGGKQYSVRLKDLIKRGDVSANVEMKPGDILVIPQSLF